MRVHRDTGRAWGSLTGFQALPFAILFIIITQHYHNHSTTEVQVDGEWRACFRSREIVCDCGNLVFRPLE